MHPLYEQADSLTQEVIDAVVKVQKHFGIGALESIYVRCLERELELSGHRTSREKGVSISSSAESNESSSKTLTTRQRHSKHEPRPIQNVAEQLSRRRRTYRLSPLMLGATTF